jgi:hypothetical protein
MALPFLYRTIRSNLSRRLENNKAARCLHRILFKSPSLRKHCRVLSISIDDFMPWESADDFSVANDIVCWLTSVRCLMIYGGFMGSSKEGTWELIESAPRHMREIQHLYMSRHGDSLPLVPVLGCINIPSLKRLDVHGISQSRDMTVLLDPEVRPAHIQGACGPGTRTRHRLIPSHLFNCV